MDAMMLSSTKSDVLKTLLKNALTSEINDREMFMKVLIIHTTTKKTNREQRPLTWFAQK